MIVVVTGMGIAGTGTMTGGTAAGTTRGGNVTTIGDQIAGIGITTTTETVIVTATVIVTGTANLLPL